MSTQHALTICWLYPKLMSTYGDRGNITVFEKRCNRRGIKTEILEIDQNTTDQELKTIDLLFGGGAQDHEQEIVMKDLHKKKDMLKKLIEQDVPALFVCGAPQLFGNYYEPGVGQRIEGLGIFDMTSVHPGTDKPRLIGNVAATVTAPEIVKELSHATIVGFENHGGRTHLGENVIPFAKVIKGFGNNGEDETEGVVYKNAIGCYLHGPLLPKNPAIADFLIKKALEIKYKTKITLKELDDHLSEQARKTILQKLRITS